MKLYYLLCHNNLKMTMQAGQALNDSKGYFTFVISKVRLNN